MGRARDHAESDAPGWSERAGHALRAYIAAHPGVRFIAPHVRHWGIREGLIDPPDNERAWGNVFRVARKRGIIVADGFTLHGDDRMHTQAVRAWRSAV